MVIVKRIDVANLAGVSEATVSRVFNNVKPLREETKQKVLAAARTLNYQPNALAQSFATGKSGNIGVIVPYLPKVNILSTYYFSEILGGIGVSLAEHNYNLLLMFQSPQEHKDYIQLFHSQKIDGCIILGSRDIPGEKEKIEKLHQLAHPYCLVNQTFKGHLFNAIDAEHYEGSFEAVSFLLKKGFRNIAFLNGSSEYSNSSERLKGYQDALMKFGIEPNPQWIFQGNYSRTSGLQAASEMITMMSKIDAVFVANDRMAIGLMQGLDKHGYSVGKDYALIGYDDSDVATMVQPQLTSVNVPLFEMGKRAAENILDALSKGHTDNFQERLPVTLIERESTI
jgi:LacI family transcriptional regulator